MQHCRGAYDEKEATINTVRDPNNNYGRKLNFEIQLFASAAARRKTMPKKPPKLIQLLRYPFRSSEKNANISLKTTHEAGRAACFISSKEKTKRTVPKDEST